MSKTSNTAIREDHKTNISLVIPTYNEDENIRLLLEKVESVLSRKGESYEIIVVDGSSPDDTGEIVKEVSQQNSSRVKLLTQPEKGGLGNAYKFGLPQAEGDIIVQMDADFSHSPKEIPKLLETIRQGNDIAIGSRYIKGGKNKDIWYRKLLSRMGNLFYRIVFSIKDPTSGFRAYRNKVITSLDWKDLPDSFAFQSVSLYQLQERGFKIEEVPINFSRRRAGRQKFTWKQVLANLKSLFSILYHKYWNEN